MEKFNKATSIKNNRDSELFLAFLKCFGLKMSDFSIFKN